jgi:hypothetical protein
MKKPPADRESQTPQKKRWGGHRPGAGRKPSTALVVTGAAPAKKKPTVPAEPKSQPRGTSDLRAAMQIIERTEAYAKKNKRRPELSPFRLPAFPDNAMPPKKARMAMDAQLDWANAQWAGATLNGASSEGLAFPGYPYLSELALRPEYRSFSETIADDATRKWIDFEITGEKDQKKKEQDEQDRQGAQRDQIAGAQQRQQGADKAPDGEAPPAAGNAPPQGRGFTDEDPEKREDKIKAAGKMDKVKAIKDEILRLGLRDAMYTISRDDGFFGRTHLSLNFGDSVDGSADEELKMDIGDGRNTMSRGKVNKDHPLKSVKPIEPVWVYPLNYNAINPLRDDWYNPQTWYVMGRQIHASRLLPFVGHPVPDLLKPAYSFGGLSLSQMAQPYVDIWLTTRESVGVLIHSFSVMVLMTDIQTIMMPGGSGVDGLMARVASFNAFRDNMGTFVVNKNTEDFKNVSASLSGLHELQGQSQEHMASVTRIPLVKLTGISPSGLNASSEGEIRVYYDTIAAYQNRFMRPNLTKVINFVQLSLFGEVDPEITFEFEPLWEMSEKEKTDLQKAEAERDQIFVDGGAISPEEWRGAIIDNPQLPYADLNPEDVPELKQEEEGGLIPPGAGKGEEAVLQDPNAPGGQAGPAAAGGGPGGGGGGGGSDPAFQQPGGGAAAGDAAIIPFRGGADLDPLFRGIAADAFEENEHHRAPDGEFDGPGAHSTAEARARLDRATAAARKHDAEHGHHHGGLKSIAGPLGYAGDADWEESKHKRGNTKNKGQFAKGSGGGGGARGGGGGGGGGRQPQQRRVQAPQQPQRRETPIMQFRREAAEIEKSLPAVKEGHVRLWRGNRPGEVGKNPVYTNDLPGIAMPFRKSYGGDLSYVDVPKGDLQKYENKAGTASNAEFTLPKEIAAKAQAIKGGQQQPQQSKTDLDWYREKYGPQRGDPLKEAPELTGGKPLNQGSNVVANKGAPQKKITDHLKTLEKIAAEAFKEATPKQKEKHEKVVQKTRRFFSSDDGRQSTAKALKSFVAKHAAAMAQYHLTDALMLPVVHGVVEQAVTAVGLGMIPGVTLGATAVAAYATNHLMDHFHLTIGGAKELLVSGVRNAIDILGGAKEVSARIAKLEEAGRLAGDEGEADDDLLDSLIMLLLALEEMGDDAGAEEDGGAEDSALAARSCARLAGETEPDDLDDLSDVEELFEDADAVEAGPMTLYVNRPLLNAADVIAWARAAGFAKTLPADDMHVTVAFSKTPLAWPESEDAPVVAEGGDRSVERLGDEGAVLLRFESEALAGRWREFKDAGASWDHPGYKPHVTFTIGADDVDLSWIEPYAGELRFGPEMFDEIGGRGKDWAAKAKASLVGDEFNESDHPRGQPENAGEFASGGGGGSKAKGKPDIRKSMVVEHGDSSQPVKSLDELYDRSRAEEPAFRAMVEKIAGATNSVPAFAPSDDGSLLKTRASAERKLKDELQGDFTKIRDVLRGTVVSGTVEDTRNAAAEFIEQQGDNILRVKDRIVGHDASGYRDILVNFRTPGGLVAELQFNSKAMVAAKQGEGHRFYDAMRTGKVMDSFKEMQAHARALYEKAYQDDGNGNWGMK